MKRKLIGSALVMLLATPGRSITPSQTKSITKKDRSRAVRDTNQQFRLEIQRKTRAIIADELGLKLSDIKSNSRFIEDLGADSLDIVELIMRYEEEFGIVIPAEDVERIHTVSDAYEYLISHAKKKVRLKR